MAIEVTLDEVMALVTKTEDGVSTVYTLDKETVGQFKQSLSAATDAAEFVSSSVSAGVLTEQVNSSTANTVRKTVVADQGVKKPEGNNAWDSNS